MTPPVPGDMIREVMGGQRAWCVVEGDCLDVLRGMPERCVDAVVTSPPYWRQREYGGASMIGEEQAPPDYLKSLNERFSEMRRVLSDTGTLWLNMGDSYAASGRGGGGLLAARRRNWSDIKERTGFSMPPNGYKHKDLTLIPFKLAENLRTFGWYLRSVIVWSKPTASEPCGRDRPAMSHEYIFLLSKQRRYFFACKSAEASESVWKCGKNTERIEHPAVMPVDLARRCIRLGCPPGGLILDPFAGSGTTAVAALREGLRCIAIENNPEYVAIARYRVEGDAPLFQKMSP